MPGTLLYAVVALALLAVALIVGLLGRPELFAERTGQGLGLLGFFILPVLVTGLGATGHLEQSKTTDFCLSCHVMEPYGKSLLVDDEGYLAAAHYQNKRIPRERACFTCHTTYTMYGDFKAKLQGLKHLYVYYLGTVPETLELYEPYANRECLSCHGGARSYEEDELHAEIRSELASGDISCLECHEPVHDVANVADLELWREAQP